MNKTSWSVMVDIIIFSDGFIMEILQLAMLMLAVNIYLQLRFSGQDKHFFCWRLLTFIMFGRTYYPVLTSVYDALIFKEDVYWSEKTVTLLTNYMFVLY
jgi:hypothetical protein